ncbi:MAG: glycoside hydrolase N-terminal domain-containing protein, partial [Terrimicrobiaceae bacterium]
MKKSPIGSDVQSSTPATHRTVVDANWDDRTVLGGASAKAPAGRHTLWYRTPAAVWDAALPIGNGRLGAMIFGGVADERLQLNEDTLWDGYPLDPSNPEALQALPEVRRLLFEGRNQEAVELAGKTMLGKPHRVKAYQSLGELLLETPALPSVSNYRRTLDLATATATVTYMQDGISFTREMFSSAPAGVIVARFTANKPGSINLRLTLKRQQDAQCFTHPTGIHTIVLRGRIACNDENGEPRGLCFAAGVRVVASGGTVANAGGVLSVTEADRVMLFIDGATNYRGGEPEELCAERLRTAAEKTFKVLKAEHVADHQKLFARVAIDLGSAGPDVEALPTDERLTRIKEGHADPGLVATHFQYGRYLLIGSSRPGALPANLQGIWCWEMSPPWNADFHTNINIQMNYWPAETTNLSECHLPLFDLMESL